MFYTVNITCLLIATFLWLSWRTENIRMVNGDCPITHCLISFHRHRQIQNIVCDYIIHCSYIVGYPISASNFICSIRTNNGELIACAHVGFNSNTITRSPHTPIRRIMHWTRNNSIWSITWYESTFCSGTFALYDTELRQLIQHDENILERTR